MAKQCLFCPNRADSAEDIWSSWILEDTKPSQPVQITIGKGLKKMADNPAVRIKAVCRPCNNGWMSKIEVENMPHMHAMINDQQTVLTPMQQKSLTRWAVLKAMVLDGANQNKRTPFYSEWERTNMKPPVRSLPVGTLTWIGRLSIKGFHAGVTDTFGKINDISKAFRSCVTTIIVGHLVIQVVTMRVLPMFASLRIRPGCNPGAWDINLLEIWPAFGEKHWPPSATFTTDGTIHHIGTLVNRYKTGEDITK